MTDKPLLHQTKPVSSGECVAPQSAERGSVERRDAARNSEVGGSPLGTDLRGEVSHAEHQGRRAAPDDSSPAKTRPSPRKAVRARMCP